jgi:hypothetical protein
VWKLAAPTSGEATSWVQLLQTQIALQYPDGKIFEGEEETPINGLDCVLAKRGEGVSSLMGMKTRFFSLVLGKDSKLLKINYYDGKGGVKKGTIILSHTSVVTSNSTNITIVRATF